MGNDADWTQTAAGESEPTGGKRGGKKSFDAYTAAVHDHGVKSPQAEKAVNDAIKDGWSVTGISNEMHNQGISAGSWPSSGGGDRRRSAGETRRATGRGGSGRRGGGGMPGPKSPPVDQ